MRKHIKSTVVMACGIFFILLGLVGLVLPFLQGLFFIAIGLLILSLYSPKIRAFMKAHTVHYPRLHEMVEKVDAWLIKTIGPV